MKLGKFLLALIMVGAFNVWADDFDEPLDEPTTEPEVLEPTPVPKAETGTPEINEAAKSIEETKPAPSPVKSAPA